MKDFYIWYCIVILVVATMGNYWFSVPDRGWSAGGSSSSYSGSSGWHK